MMVCQRMVDGKQFVPRTAKLTVPILCVRAVYRNSSIVYNSMVDPQDSDQSPLDFSGELSL